MYKRSFYQDRLGTNTGKVEKRGACFAGVYGVPLACKQKRRYDPVTPMRLMEAFIRRVGGYSFLYADTFLTRDELREMFDHSLCDACRGGGGGAGAPPPPPSSEWVGVRVYLSMPVGMPCELVRLSVRTSVEPRGPSRVSCACDVQ
jgi:hypothetical protein